MAEKEIRVSITADAKALISAVQDSVKSLKSLAATRVSGSNIAGITKSAEKAQSALKKTGDAAKSGLNNVNDSADRASVSIENLTKKITMVGKAVAASFVVGKILDIGKAALSASADIELLHKGLAFSLGDAGADQLIKTMQDLGEASAYDTTELLPMARAWVNIGNNAEQAAAKMATIIDAGSAYGMTADKLNSVNIALTQMQMKGKVSAEEMMQLTEAGLPAWTLLSEKMGLPVEQLQDMASKSMLTQDAMDTLFAAMKDKTEGAASSMASTLTGQWSNIQEALTNSMAAIGDIISMAFNVPGVLTELGNLAEQAKAVISSIRDNAKAMGIGQAIILELYKVSPAAAKMAADVENAFNEIKSFIVNNETAIKNLIVAITSVAATVKIWYTMVNAVKAVQSALMAARIAAIAFQAACAANPVLLALSLIVAAIALVVMNWDFLKETASKVMTSIQNAVTACTDWLKNKFQSAIDAVTGWWNNLKSTFSGGMETTVVVHEQRTGGTKGYATGGIFGMATGGIVGGLVPLANGGQLKHGTPAIVGEAGPEAVIPLKDNVLSKIGESIMAAYQKGKSGGSQVMAIQTRISTIADTGNLSVYAQKLQEAQDKANEVGKELAKFRDYQEQCNEEAARYADDGEATLEYQRKMLSNQQQIAALTEKINAGKAADGSTEKIALLQKQGEQIKAQYQQQKQAAISAAKEAADARVAIETNAQNALASIQISTADKIYGRQAALEEAQRQQKLANQQADLESYMAVMSAKDEITGQSYATTLANEQYLNEQRAVWHDQMMLQAVEWGTYMQTLLTTMSSQIQGGLASGLAQCIAYGESFSATMQQLGQQVLKTFIQDVLKKALSQLGLIRAANAANTKVAVAGLNAQTAATAGLAATYASAATAALIAMNPWSAGGAAAIVSGQMSSAAGASQALSATISAKSKADQIGAIAMASGGIVTGPTLSLVGEGRYDEAVIPLKPGILDRLYGESSESGRTTTVTQNIYGDINSGSDEEDLFSNLNSMLAEGMRS